MVPQQIKEGALDPLPLDYSVTGRFQGHYFCEA